MKVNNLEFYRAEESAIRTAMKQFEAGLFSVAEQAVKDAGFEVQNFPKEGYFDDDALAGFFDRVRTLQNNFTGRVTPAIKKLHEIYTSPVFGIKQARSTALNPDNVYYKRGDLLHPSQPVTIPSMVDPITIASDKTGPGWTIEKIMNAIDRENLGQCLVGLGIIVDDIEMERSGKHNPLATCMACETTVLTREVCCPMAAPPIEVEVEWNVSPEVESYGRKVVDGYRFLFEKHSKFPLELRYVSSENVYDLLNDASSMERCVNINADFLTGRPNPYYHWAIKCSSDGAHRVVDFFAGRIVTTQEWKETESRESLREIYDS